MGSSPGGGDELLVDCLQGAAFESLINNLESLECDEDDGCSYDFMNDFVNKSVSISDNVFAVMFKLPTGSEFETTTFEVVWKYRSAACVEE